MSVRSVRAPRRAAELLVLALLVVAPWICPADEPSTRPFGFEPRVESGKNLSPADTLLGRESADGSWQKVGAKETIYTRDHLLALPGTKATVEPRPLSVNLTLWGNLPQLSSFPGLESEVVIHDSRAFDLDFSLVHGRVVVANKKPKGSAKVWVRLPQAAFQIVLAEPGDELALEIYGRWPRGVGFSKEPHPGEVPTTVLVGLVLKGQVEMSSGTQRHTLTAPPGPAYLHWDSVAGLDDGPQKRDKLPAWADPKTEPGPERKLAEQVVALLQTRLKDKSPEDALLDLLSAAGKESDKAKAVMMRQYAILGLAAMDELPRVAEALAEGNATVRETAIVALRHWIGETAHGDQTLYQLLRDRLGYPAAQSETIMQLLHSPFEADQPEAFTVLLAYLRHDKLSVRSLALWHLQRLAPAGKDIKYDPAASEAERDKGITEWKKLIASGKLQPEKKEGKDR
jgi:hypothetical protein